MSYQLEPLKEITREKLPYVLTPAWASSKLDNIANPPRDASAKLDSGTLVLLTDNKAELAHHAGFVRAGTSGVWQVAASVTGKARETWQWFLHSSNFTAQKTASNKPVLHNELPKGSSPYSDNKKYLTDEPAVIKKSTLGPHEGLPLATKNSFKKTVTSEEASKLFDKAKADKNIPFNYPIDCCYSRAHEMCRQFEENGVLCRKAWNYASPGNSLIAKTEVNPITPDGMVEWRYHVAPLLAVTQPNGSLKDYIIDPSLHDKPVPLDEWKKRMNDKESVLKITDSKPYYESLDGSIRETDSNYKKTSGMLKEHRSTRDSLMSN